MKNKLKSTIFSAAIILTAVVFIAASNASVIAQTTTSDLDALNNGYENYDPLEGYGQGVCGYATGGEVEDIDNQRETVIRAIIGVAKTYNLGTKGALIGLMVGLAESNLQIYASSVIPESKTSPDWLAVAPESRVTGSDHDSVGIMQQRPSTGWSTYGGNYNNVDSTTKRQIVWQIMNPVYSAQAFFGTPDGAQLPDSLEHPGALRKGLQNKEGWESLDPWIAAQRVQISFDETGSNYRDKLERAQELLDQYWESSSAVPLAIDVNFDNNNPTELSCVGTDFTNIIQAYAWPDHRGNGYTERTESYIEATNRARENNEYVGSCNGVDCGGFVTRVMRDSGMDPEYNSPNSNVRFGQHPYIEDNLGSKYVRIQPSSTKDLLPGDIWMRGGPSPDADGYLGHTWIYVGEIDGFEGNIAESSECERAPMASNVSDSALSSDNFFFRLVSVDAAEGGQNE